MVGDSPEYTDPSTGQTYINWLLPVCFYNDKTGVGAIEGKYTLEPLMFSICVIRQKHRQNANAWRHVGFVPNYHNGTSDDGNNNNAEQALALFHELLGVLLNDFEQLQANPPLLSLNLFGRQVQIRPILEVAFVIGDQLSQDSHSVERKAIVVVPDAYTGRA